MSPVVFSNGVIGHEDDALARHLAQNWAAVDRVSHLAWLWQCGDPDICGQLPSQRESAFWKGIGQNKEPLPPSLVYWLPSFAFNEIHVLGGGYRCPFAKLANGQFRFTCNLASACYRRKLVVN